MPQTDPNKKSATDATSGPKTKMSTVKGVAAGAVDSPKGKPRGGR